jgi:hypothetical protein
MVLLWLVLRSIYADEEESLCSSYFLSVETTATATAIIVTIIIVIWMRRKNRG